MRARRDDRATAFHVTAVVEDRRVDLPVRHQRVGIAADRRLEVEVADVAEGSEVDAVDGIDGGGDRPKAARCAQPGLAAEASSVAVTSTVSARLATCRNPYVMMPQGPRKDVHAVLWVVWFCVYSMAPRALRRAATGRPNRTAIAVPTP